MGHVCCSQQGTAPDVLFITESPDLYMVLKCKGDVDAGSF